MPGIYKIISPICSFLVDNPKSGNNILYTKNEMKMTDVKM
jgi:hypothetical protein